MVVAIHREQVSVLGGGVDSGEIECGHVYHIVSDAIGEVSREVELSPSVTTDEEREIESSADNRQGITEFDERVTCQFGHTGIGISEWCRDDFAIFLPLRLAVVVAVEIRRGVNAVSAITIDVSYL